MIYAVIGGVAFLVMADVWHATRVWRRERETRARVAAIMERASSAGFAAVRGPKASR